MTQDEIQQGGTQIHKEIARGESQLQRNVLTRRFLDPPKKKKRMGGAASAATFEPGATTGTRAAYSAAYFTHKLEKQDAKGSGLQRLRGLN